MEKPDLTLIEATRKDLQLGRRLFHVGNGLFIALLYTIFFTRERLISLIGTLAAVTYLVDQVRLSYPEITQRYQHFIKYIMRAEEQVKESGMVPYSIAILLSIIIFPKQVAIIAILTLALADPASALVGIKYGKRHWVKDKTVEGSIAFATVCFFVCLSVLLSGNQQYWSKFFFLSLLTALGSAGFEMIPIKIDDNLTIPLFTGFFLWFLSLLFNISMV